MAVSKLNPAAAGIPFGDNDGRPANPTTGQPYFNGEVQRLEVYTGSTYGWQNIIAETPGVTGYSGSISDSAGGTISISGSNFAGGCIVSLVGTSGTEYLATSVSVSNLTSLTATFDAVSGAEEPYDIRITNPSNLYGVYYDILTVNDSPIWSTAAGLLGTIYSGVPVTYELAATDDENNSLTYSIYSGTLPTGLSINSSTGAISGTPTGLNTSVTTYSFVVRVSDGTNTANRSFSISYAITPTVTGGTLSSDSTYYYRTFTGNGTLTVANNNLPANVMVIGGGGAGGYIYPGNGYHMGGGGGGAGGFRSASVTISVGNSSIVVGGGGSASSYSVTNGVNSSALSIESAGGGYGAYNPSSGNFPGNSGGSGGGAGRDNPNFGYGNTPSTIPSQGNNGGSYGSNNAGAGGGGAGAVGADSTSNTPGNGGAGTNAYSSWLTGISSAMTGVSGWSTATSSGYIAGGGGGGAGNGNTGTSSGGAGGGAGQSSYGGSNGVAAVTNTGGGGAGASAHNNPNGYQGGPGGSGLVVIRYSKASVGG